jgi:hypothetical protein
VTHHLTVLDSWSKLFRIPIIHDKDTVWKWPMHLSTEIDIRANFSAHHRLIKFCIKYFEKRSIHCKATMIYRGIISQFWPWPLSTFLVSIYDPVSLGSILCPVFFVTKHITCKNGSNIFTFDPLVRPWPKSYISSFHVRQGEWLRCLPLNPGIMGSSPNRVTTMFLHMTPVLVGSRKPLESD